MFQQGSLTERVRLSTVDLLVLASLDQFFFYIENIINRFYKTIYLNQEVNCSEPSPQLVFPGFSHFETLTREKVKSALYLRMLRYFCEIVKTANLGLKASLFNIGL
jgi:hypothetical protein